MAENIRVLIVDDHDIVREGQRALINTEPGMEVIGEAKNGFEAIELADTLQPDVILMDLHMPEKDGIEASEGIKRRNPEARILVLTSFAEDERVSRTGCPNPRGDTGRDPFYQLRDRE